MNWDPQTIDHIDTIGELIEIRGYVEHLEGFGDRHDGFAEKLRWRLMTLFSKTEGYSDLRDLARADFDANWMRKKRAEVALQQHKLPKEINKLSISDFARAIVGSAKPAAGATANEKMAAKMISDPDSIHWTRKRWAEYCGVKEGTVQGTESWEKIMVMRLAEKLRRSDQPNSRITNQNKKSESFLALLLQGFFNARSGWLAQKHQPTTVMVEAVNR